MPAVDRIKYLLGRYIILIKFASESVTASASVGAVAVELHPPTVTLIADDAAEDPAGCSETERPDSSYKAEEGGEAALVCLC